MKLTSYAHVEPYLSGYIATGPLELYVGDRGLQRVKHLLSLLGDPQEKIKVVHIAGTSGKGSTAYMISHLLISLGKKTALHLSPHLIDIRERAQINNALIPEEAYVQYLNEIIPAIESMKASVFGSPSYFEILTALSYTIAFREKVDYMVVETGLGGLYDATNSVSNANKVCVITRIGFDHMHILGDTLPKIAVQKAGIIHEGNIVISSDQEPSVQGVLVSKTKENMGTLHVVSPGRAYPQTNFSETETIFDFFSEGVSFTHLHCSLVGMYQVENVSLALETVAFLSQRDHFAFSEDVVRSSLKSAHFLGRFDIRRIDGKTVILDGAHNPQKMEALVTSLKQIYPEKKFHFLVGFSKAKDFMSMMKLIIPLASCITITQFSTDTNDMIHLSQPADRIVAALVHLGFSSFEVITGPHRAMEHVLASGDSHIVVTGSLYLLGELYKNIA